MDKNSQMMKREAECINADENFENEVNENLELFKRALSEGLEAKFRKTEEETEDMEMPPLSRRHKIRMNRLFRERVGGKFLPFPEVDNIYERMRSRLIIKLKIKKRLDCRKQR